MDTQRLIQLRAQKDKFFKENPNSPLTDAQKVHFTGLSYYVAQPNWDLVVEVTPFAKKDNVQIQHTKGEARWFMRYGEFTFDVRGVQGRLTIYRAANYFFLPFVDANATCAHSGERTLAAKDGFVAAGCPATGFEFLYWIR